MDIDFQKVADAIEKSSPEIKDLMFSAELGENVQNISEKSNLNEETTLKLVDEIGYVILDLKSRGNFLDSLTSIGIAKDIAIPVANQVESEIFVHLDKIKNRTLGNEVVEKSEEAIQKMERKGNIITPSSGVGGEFEQIILNQARAMKPAVAAESGYGLAKPTAQVPENLPIVEEKPKVIHNYMTSNDPYREPLE